MNHNQNDGLLKMIRRTDPMILYSSFFFTKVRQPFLVSKYSGIL